MTVVWPLKEKPIPLGVSLVSFTVESWSEKEQDIVTTINITSPDLVLKLVEKAIRSHNTVVLKDLETGELVAFERESRTGRRRAQRLMFLHFRTSRQERVIVERFPWEESR